MQKDYTHISIVLDRSGSMGSIRDDVVGGFNAFLREQQATPGTATLSLVQFDSQNPYEVLHDFKAVQAVDALTREAYSPRASTPLFDAVGTAVRDLEQKLVAMKADDRPEFVIVVIITDGLENASLEYSADHVRRMIAEKRELAGWKFVYLSADISAVEEAIHRMGVLAQYAMAFDKTAKGSQEVFSSMSANLAHLRRRESTEADFSEADRLKHEAETERRRKK